MENPPFEDVFPIQDGDFPLLCLFTGGYIYLQGGPRADRYKRSYNRFSMAGNKWVALVVSLLLGVISHHL